MARPSAGAALDVRSVGPLQVVIDGTPVDVSGARQRALLVLLVLHANEHVSRDRVVEELWNGSAPHAAQASLRVAVSKLRRLLGQRRDRLETVNGGYRLRLEPMELDANRFEALLEQARE